MLVLFMIGIFMNGAVNGNWYATVVDLNLPEHRGTVLATANFFDIIGKSIGPVVGAIFADTLGFVFGMMISIFFWILIPLFWIVVLKNLIIEMDATESKFSERLESLAKKSI
jgi:MFS family permease